MKLSCRSRFALLHCKKDISKGLILGENGYVLPESYVPVKFVEDLFRRPDRMSFFLKNSSKAKKRLESGNTENQAFKDHIIIPVVKDMCRTLFNHNSVQDLHPREQAEILRQVGFRFSANINQLARGTGLSYQEVVRLLESL